MLLERMAGGELTKEKAGCWTRRRTFAQVRRGSNIQLLPFPLVRRPTWPPIRCRWMRGPRGYDLFKNKRDGCVRAVFQS
jgi:hypothetical protein